MRVWEEFGMGSRWVRNRFGIGSRRCSERVGNGVWDPFWTVFGTDSGQVHAGFGTFLKVELRTITHTAIIKASTEML